MATHVEDGAQMSAGTEANFSVAGLVTVPLGGTTGFGAWNLHAGVEFQALGDTTKAFNGGKGHRAIVSGGVGFSY